MQWLLFLFTSLISASYIFIIIPLLTFEPHLLVTSVIPESGSILALRSDVLVFGSVDGTANVINKELLLLS